MKLAAFDLEIAVPMSDDCRNVYEHDPPLGISCAAVALSGTEEVKVWQDPARLSEAAARDIVAYLKDLTINGYTLVTWNGCHFDFAVLAKESDLLRDCALLALSHTDLMLLVAFQKGYGLKLEKALQGAGLAGKLKEVALADGTILRGMNGVMAPELWARGEREAVLAYLKQDTLMTLRLAQSVLATKRIRWTSNRGTPQEVVVPRLLPVRDCLKLPEPDVSWMNTPPRPRGHYINWIPGDVA
ncbi:MAG: ribonuclease H-like domain-containing protein [Firmicutes bacterium]|nr:ribonuclease H-like domain-containing protein [Bacillota bacterium]